MKRSNLWEVIYYEDIKGISQVFDFIENRNDREKAKIFAWLDLLEDQGPQLPRPYADLLEDGIHELRIKLSGDQTRILYFFCFQKYIILTNCFTKTSQQVPLHEIRKAKQCRSNFISRYNDKNIKEALDENL
jgi:phage-related protein